MLSRAKHNNVRQKQELVKAQEETKIAIAKNNFHEQIYLNVKQILIHIRI